jgi:hypothetical protein
VMSQTLRPAIPDNLAIAGESQWTEEQHLVYLLHDRDTPCPRCAANLRGLQVPRCPVCDSELVLSLSPVKSPLGAWIAAMVPLCMSAGLGVFFVFVLLKEGWPKQPGLLWVGLRISLAYFMASIPVAGAIVVLKRRYQRLTAASQRLLAALSIVLTGLAMVMLVLFFWLR